MISLLCGILKKNRLIDTENTLVTAKGRGGVGETSNASDRYKLPVIE